jgi:glycerol-1-phosphate dehydrogenase [NAD(P)+]
VGSFFFQDHLDRYDASGARMCSCGREHRLGVKRILLGQGVLEQLPELVRARFGSAASIWVLSDGNTESAAGGACKRLLARFRVGETVLPAEPKPKTTFELAARLAAEAAGHAPGLILSVGGGTINDLGKMVSEDLGVPNWSVATAPAADAYASGTSAVKGEGRHYTLPVRPTEVILADLSVLEQAPETLFLSGCGDLLAKYLSYHDWRLAALLAGEYFCPVAAELCLESAREAIEAARGLDSDRRGAVRSLTDAIISSGLAMQSLMSSRPASSAEHVVAHFWELAHMAGDPSHDQHGLLVGLACRVLLPAYRRFYAELPGLELDLRRRRQELRRELPWEQTLTPELLPFREQMREEMGSPTQQQRGGQPAAGQLSEEELARHLQKLIPQRQEVAKAGLEKLDELAEAVKVLEKASFPFRLSLFGFGPEQAYLPFPYVRFLRRRYGSFHLIHEVGREAELLADVRGQLAAIA